MTIENFLKPAHQIEQKEFHPATKAFPLPTRENQKSLKQDILKNGILTPITLLDGKILDGRARYLVCLEEGIEPTYIEIHTDSPLSYIASMNVKRRHLDETQRAWIGASIFKTNEVERVQICTRSDVAEMMNISERSISSAISVHNKGVPELHAAVLKGEIAISMAAKIVEFDPDTQKKLVTLGSKQKIAAAIRQENNIQRRRGENGQTRDQDVSVAFSQEELNMIQKGMRRHNAKTRDDFIRMVVLDACKEQNLPDTIAMMKKQFQKLHGKSHVKRSYTEKEQIVDRKIGSSKEERDMEAEYEAFVGSPFFHPSDRAFEDFIAMRQGR